MSDPIRAALEELVACKDLKDEIEKMDGQFVGTVDEIDLRNRRYEYGRRKPIAWKVARDVLAAPQEADKDGELTKIGMLIRPRSGLINFVRQIDALPLEVHETMEVFAALPLTAIKGEPNG